MKNAKIENSLRNAINEAPTVDFESLSAIHVVKMPEHDHITRQQEKRAFRSFKNYSVAISCCLIVLVYFSGWFVQLRLPDSVVTLDVNPSIEIVTNRQGRVLSVNALNNDAQSIVGTQDYNNSELNDAINSILISMINEGYLSADKNSILLSVKNQNLEKAQALALSLGQEITTDLTAHNISPQVEQQVFTEDKEASALAEKYGVSTGKIRLIEEIRSSDSTRSIDSLANMSMEELLSISSSEPDTSNEITVLEEDSSNENVSPPPTKHDQSHDASPQSDVNQNESHLSQSAIDDVEDSTLTEEDSSVEEFDTETEEEFDEVETDDYELDEQYDDSDEDLLDDEYEEYDDK